MTLLDSIVWDVIIRAWKKNLLSLMASHSQDTQNRIAVILASIIGLILAIDALSVLMHSIVRYGNHIMALFQRGVIFITLTVILLIIRLITLSVSPRKSMQRVIRMNFTNSGVSMQIRYAHLQKNGMLRQKALPGILSTVRILGKIGNLYSTFVYSVVKNINRWLNEMEKGSVLAPASQNIMKLPKDTMKTGLVWYVVLLLMLKNPSHNKSVLANVGGLFVAKNKSVVYCRSALEFYAQCALFYANVWAFTELMVTNEPTADDHLEAMKRRLARQKGAAA